MTSPRFTWDEDKNLSNQRKHGVSFELAARVFLDPLHLSVQDRVEGGEQRWQTLGQIGGVAVVLVAHTFTEDGPTDAPVEVIRIISARPATRRERTRYEEG
ncbi:BrnT family toxin [Tateyamaria sp.]|uniref:BrnT family toxin n=1 Tax=Tateyamaria sp. TaxID=1929288 RepID=UPI00329AEF19